MIFHQRVQRQLQLTTSAVLAVPVDLKNSGLCKKRRGRAHSWSERREGKAPLESSVSILINRAELPTVLAVKGCKKE